MGWGQVFCGDLLKHLPGPGPQPPFLGRSGALHQGGPPPYQLSTAAMVTQPPCTGLTHQLAGMLNGRRAASLAEERGLGTGGGTRGVGQMQAWQSGKGDVLATWPARLRLGLGQCQEMRPW